MAEYKVIGTRVPRIDAKEKVTGKAMFYGDLQLSRMLYGKVLRSPYAHAKILNIDTSKAERLLGSDHVITYKDVPHNRWGHSGRNDEEVLASNKVRYVGDEVAAVAATSLDLAEEALGLISVEYEELPAVFDIEEAMKPGAPIIHDEDLDTNIVWNRVLERGDIEKGFQEADVIVEETFTTQGVSQAYMEPIGCVADWDATGKLTVWLGSMWPHGIRLDLATILDLPLSKIRVINCYAGGCFGEKIRIAWSIACAVLLAKKVGRPVKMADTREEALQSARHRSATKIRMKLGAKKDGTITTEDATWIHDNGAYTFHARQVVLDGCLRNDAIYRWKNTRWDIYVVYTNKGVTANFRGHGSAQPTFVRESMMDILAEKLGMDTAELKIKNAVRPGDTSVHGWRTPSAGLVECIEKTAEASGWKEKRAKKEFGRGIGMASVIHESDWRIFPGVGGTTAFVELLDDGRVKIRTGEAEYGQGGDTSQAICAAEELCIPLDQIIVQPVDTDISPFGLGPFGSKLLITQSAAIQLACQDLKRQLFDKASEMLGVKIEDLELIDGQVRVKGSPEKLVSFAQIGRASVFGRDSSALIGKGIDERDTDYCTALDHPTWYGHPISECYFDTLVSEVEVDPETGEVKILGLWVAVDCGKVINLTGLEGQVLGARAQGIGNTFFEEYIYDKKGRMVNRSFADYKIASALDMPPTELFWVETLAPSNPYGAKGGGENPAIDTVAPATANAIYKAIGVRIKDLPITPDKILKALEAKRGGKKA